MRSLCVGSGAGIALAREVLSERGSEVVLAPDGAAALAALARGPAFEVAVVGAAGAPLDETVRTLRSHVRGQALPVLALVDAAAVEAALDAGAAFALPEPVGHGTVAAAVAALGRLARRAPAELGPAGPDHEVLFEKNPHPMWFFDVDTLRFVAVNEAAVEKYGWSREEFLAMTLKDIRPPEDLERLLQVTSRVVVGIDHSPGWRHRAKDGRIFHVDIISHPVRYAGRACELVLAHDVTERVEAQRQLDELRAQLALSDRMASIGTLAAGVAHEINNPLTSVIANLEFAEAQLPPSWPGADAVHGALADAADGARRVKQIAGDLRTFSRPDDATIAPVDLSRVAASALALSANELRHRARVQVDVAAAPPVLANEARLGQVLLNLLVNAAHALPEGDAGRNEIRISARHEGDAVVLEVSDTGPGVPPEIRDRIFDPFFTTKPIGEGTGLGLWVCRRVVTALGGTIELVPGGARGATFRVRLPAAGAPARREARPPSPHPPEARPGQARPRVLVVDDQPLVGRALQRALRVVADVDFEPSSRAAVERLARGERYDLVLADVMMPELAGPDFHAALEQLDPALARRVVFMTGGAFSARAQELLARIPNVCLEKPLDLDRIRALLGGR